MLYKCNLTITDDYSLGSVNFRNLYFSDPEYKYYNNDFNLTFIGGKYQSIEFRYVK